MDLPAALTKPSKLNLTVSASQQIVEPKGPRLKLQMVGQAILFDLPGELDDQTLIGGIIVPEAARKRMQQIRDAIVLSVGPDVTPLTGIKEGDRVLVRRVQIEQIVHDGNSYFMGHPGLVVAILPE